MKPLDNMFLIDILAINRRFKNLQGRRIRGIMSEFSCLSLRTCHYSEVFSPVLLSFREQQTILYISNVLLKAELKQ